MPTPFGLFGEKEREKGHPPAPEDKLILCINEEPPIARIFFPSLRKLPISARYGESFIEVMHMAKKGQKRPDQTQTPPKGEPQHSDTKERERKATAAFPGRP